MKPSESWNKARVTLGLSLLIAACWLILSILGLEQWAWRWGGFRPARLGIADDGSLAPFWLTPLTATLLNPGILLLGFNLLVLVVCGRKVEKVLGPASLAILYVVGAYVAAGAEYLIDPHQLAPMIGASGAVSAVLGANAMLFSRNRVGAVRGRLAVWLNALWLMAAWLGLQLLVAVAAAGSLLSLSGGIANGVAANIGGFIVGVILANPLLLFRYRKA
jgi:membrane associated rhomboid family serine protease